MADKKQPTPKKAEQKKAAHKKGEPKKTTAKMHEEKRTDPKRPISKGREDKNATRVRSQKPSFQGLKLLGGLLFKKMAAGGAGELRAKTDEVNRLNVFPVPDGDTGDNMRMTIESGIRAVENMDSDDLASVMKALSHGMLLGARGNSGVILSQFFAGMAQGLEGAREADAETLGEALKCGVERAYASVMTPTEGTILTVAREAVDYATSKTTAKSTIRSFFRDLVSEMRASVERTPEILPMLKEAGVVDSGGAGLFYIMDGFNRVLNNREIDTSPTETLEKVSAEAAAMPNRAFGPDSKMPFGYCTEFLLQLRREKCDPEAFDVERLKNQLSSLGDSIVAFREGTIVKVHIHTHTPDRVLARCLKYGDFIAMKIENMSLQHSGITIASEGEDAEDGKNDPPTLISEKAKEIKPIAVVAVCNGEGMISLYRELGADIIILGGQTNNPSSGDFLDAFSRLRAKSIIVLPNNGNILMAAAQAAELYTDSRVHVIPTKSMGTGYIALSSVDLSSEDSDAVAYEMTEATAGVISGFISPSVRDADMNGVHVTAGDTIGIVGKEIVVSEADLLTAAVKLGEYLLSGSGQSTLTVFAGADTTAEEAEALKAAISEKFPQAEIYLHNGGQEIYPYLMVVE